MFAFQCFRFFKNGQKVKRYLIAVKIYNRQKMTKVTVTVNYSVIMVFQYLNCHCKMYCTILQSAYFELYQFRALRASSIIQQIFQLYHYYYYYIIIIIIIIIVVIIINLTLTLNVQQYKFCLYKLKYIVDLMSIVMQYMS